MEYYLVSGLNEEATYDYVFGGPLERSALSSTLKLTSPPIRLRSDGKYCKYCCLLKVLKTSI